VSNGTLPLSHCEWFRYKKSPIVASHSLVAAAAVAASYENVIIIW
jgi:hypothetical protein